MYFRHIYYTKYLKCEFGTWHGCPYTIELPKLATAPFRVPPPERTSGGCHTLVVHGFHEILLCCVDTGKATNATRRVAFQRLPDRSIIDLLLVVAPNHVLPSSRQLAWVIVKDPEQFSDPERVTLAHIHQESAVAKVYDLAQQFVVIIKQASS